MHPRPPRSLFALLLAGSAASAVAAEPIDLRRLPPVTGDIAAGKERATLCAACHGVDGIAPVPTFPNLAGQPIDYLYSRLVAFQRAGKPDSPMTPLVATLDAAAMRDLAAYYASLPAPAPAPGTTDTASAGRSVFLDGDPANGTPPCQGCHGAEAQGHPDAASDARWRSYPALRGQHAAYLEQRLREFAADEAPATSAGWIMGPIARTLDPATRTAIAEWLEAGAR